MTRAVRLGLVGAGPWGRKIAATLKAMSEVELSGIAGRADWRALLADVSVAGIVIATPPATHAEIALAAIAAGKAVLVEKPLALDVASAEAVLARADKAGAVAMTNHVHLFHPGYAELKRRLAALGPVHFLRGRGGRRGPFRADVPVLWDWGPHDVAFALDLLGFEPERVSAEARARASTPEGMGENLAVRLAYADGASAELEFGNLYDSPVRELIVRCDKCDLVLDENSPEPLVRLPRRETEACLPSENAAEGAAETIPVTSESPLKRALSAFADKIRAGRRDTESLALGVAVTKALARAERALASGKPA